jgi:ubiquinone/menaquinone biosynthesis C-methylase UbiE
VLELGCGLGDLLADMLAAGYTCRAVEQSPQMLAAARETLHKRRVGSPDLVTHGSAQHLPYPNANFDNVVSTFPSEYIYDQATIAEITRVLRPGGRLIVIEGANLLPAGFVQTLMQLPQYLVYGPRPHGENSTDTDHITSSQTEPTTEVITAPQFGMHIPLEQNGLSRRAEIVRSPKWEVYMTIGEKPE